MHLIAIISFIFFNISSLANAKTTTTTEIITPQRAVKNPQFPFIGLFRARFLAAMIADVDVLGMQHKIGEVKNEH